MGYKALRLKAEDANPIENVHLGKMAVVMEALVEANISAVPGCRIKNLGKENVVSCCRKRIEYWHEIGPVLEIERAMEMKEAS